MIKKSFRLMLLAAFALSSVMFVACNKYDDDIQRIDDQLASLEQTVQTLKAAVDGGAVISSVSNTAEGVKFTLSNGQSYTVNHGTDGANGADGKDAVVTIGENGNWFINGEDTGKTAKGQGEPGKSPRINEAGNWEIWNAETEAWEDTNVSAAGAQTYVVDCGSYYELNVMQQVDGANAGFTTIKLSKTTPITSIEVVSPVGKPVVLNYGKALSSKLTFNGVTYAKNSHLIPAGSGLVALMNPVDTDASVYEFALMDSHGNKPYVITGVSKNTSTYPMSKAANLGYWNMSVALADGLEFADYAGYDYAAERSSYIYALATNTANGLVASKYTIEVEENKVSEITDIKLNNLKRSVTKSINLVNAFSDEYDYYNTQGVVENNTAVAKVDGESVSDLKDYLIDCYFKIADQTIAETYGLKLDGNVLTAEKPTTGATVKIKAYYLLADGTEVDAADNDAADEFEVEFTYATPGADALTVEWTVKSKTRTDDGVSSGIRTDAQHVFLPLESIQAALKGATDTDLPTVEAGSWTATSGYHMDNYTYVVNDTYYGYGGADANHKFAGHENSWIATVDESVLYYMSTSNSRFYKATDKTIQTPLYVKFTFDYEEAFPGEYLINLYFKKGNNTSGNDDLKVPVKVVIKSPAETDVNPFQRLGAYFSGDDAVAYGTADGSYAYYNLFSLYADMDGEEANVSFKETKHQISGHSCASWLVDATSGDIKVGAYNYDVNNRDNVYATREIKAKYVVFGNEHIPYINDTFNLTIKSAIAEGTFSTTASKTIETSNPVYFSVNDFTTVDVAGDKFYLGKTYVYDAEAGAYTNTAVTGTGKDSRIKAIKIYAADDNAENYLTIGEEFAAKGTAAADAFSVARKSTVTRLTQDTPCKVTVRITDNWGRRSEATVTVTLKAFGN